MGETMAKGPKNTREQLERDRLEKEEAGRRLQGELKPLLSKIGSRAGEEALRDVDQSELAANRREYEASISKNIERLEREIERREEASLKVIVDTHAKIEVLRQIVDRHIDTTVALERRQERDAEIINYKIPNLESKRNKEVRILHHQSDILKKHLADERARLSGFVKQTALAERAWTLHTAMAKAEKETGRSKHKKQGKQLAEAIVNDRMKEARADVESRVMNAHKELMGGNVKTLKDIKALYEQDLGAVGRIQLFWGTAAKQDRTQQFTFLSDLSNLLDKRVKLNPDATDYREQNLIMLGAIANLKELLIKERKSEGKDLNTSAINVVDAELRKMQEAVLDEPFRSDENAKYVFADQKELRSLAAKSYQNFVKECKVADFPSVTNKEVLKNLLPGITAEQLKGGRAVPPKLGSQGNAPEVHTREKPKRSGP
jgi:hypothetical protein